MNIRTFIVDDEPLARQRMLLLLEGVPDIDIVGEFGNGHDTIEAVLADPPDLVFLDIQLPDHDGIEVVSELAAEMKELPLIVFATAYNEHAIAAFEVNALDYLLKPISRDRLLQSIERVRSVLSTRTRGEEEERLRGWIDSKQEEQRNDASSRLTRIELKERGDIEFIPVSEVEYFQADGNYIEIHLPTRTPLLRSTLAKLEATLDPDLFVRVSRSVVVPVSQVAAIEKEGRNDVWIRLQSGERLGASRNLEKLRELVAKS
ncbi:MAG: response regulator transcription factor [Verrucomicrobiota bacterium]